MRYRILIYLLLSCSGLAADKKDITGVWRAQREGLPAFVMTIANEGDEFTGAILFYMVQREGNRPPQATPGIPEPMFNMTFDGKILNFKVSRRHGPEDTSSEPPASFQMSVIGPNDGLIGDVKVKREAKSRD